MPATKDPDTKDSATEHSGNDKGSDAQLGTYVYGIIPSDVEFTEEMTGVGDPPAQVEVLREGDIAALASEVRVDRPLGTPQDLMAHEQVLDTAAAVAPVLPMRFGAVLTDTEAVSQDLLRPHGEEFRAALAELEGRAQFVAKARYVGDAILREVLQESGEARSLRDAIREGTEDETREQRVQLGELIGKAIAKKRESDTQVAVKRLEPCCESMSVREPSHEDDAVHLALLVKTDRQEELEGAMTELQQKWEGRAAVRLLGPMAPYDFVVTQKG
ncbi:MAG: GvpL/GvpF family gas vesicle protein [Acidimicrobiaceae bacterium]|nr:GvpL/GvpF family gas vesicle protein [Acidimicrobiaceae bacterium]